MKSLGTVGFRQRGDWTAHTFFREDDTVQYERSTMYALEDHESGDEFDPTKWGYLTDVRGVSEAIAGAQTAAGEAAAAAQNAAEKAAEAEEQAQEARDAATAATTQAEAAKEATGIFTENFKHVISDEFAYAIVDLEGTLLWGIRHDGTVYQPKGVPEETKKLLSKMEGYQIVESPEYMFAITDKNDNVLFAIDRKGGSFVNSVSGVCIIEQFDSKEYLFAVMDSAGNLLFGVTRDGTFQVSKFALPPELLKMLKEASQGFTEIDERDNEFLYKVTDVDGMILFAVRLDGTVYMPKGIPEEQKQTNRRLDRRMSDLEKRLANFKGGTGDWSDNGSMRVPIPRLAIVNILSGVMPTAKSGLGTPGVNCDIPCQWEFWDQQGNYAKIWVKMSCQGSSSMAFIKKNLAIDMFADASLEEGFVIKFGDWVPQDSFHLKAYYTDAFRGVGVCSYMLYEEIMATRSMTDNAPYKEAFADNYGTIADEYQKNSDLSENYDTGAKCFPMGFPVAVYKEGEFYGLYSWQIKKHRDNYHMNKKTAEHIHLDGTLTPDAIWGGNILWNSFEVRNPKSLICADGSKYDGDRPTELIGKDSELYDNADKDMKRTAATKKCLIDLSGRVGEIRTKDAELGASTIQSQLNSLVSNHTHTSSTGLNAMTSIAFVGRDEWLVYLTKDNTSTNDATLISWLNARRDAANAVAGFAAKNVPAIDTTKCVKVFENGAVVDSAVWQQLLADAGLEGYTLDFNGTTGKVYPEGTHISLAAPTESRCWLKIVNVHDLISAMDAYLSECSQTMRSLIDRYFNVSFMIDYIIHAQIINNADGFNKNWQWTTWDGVRWTVNPYDLDMSFGGHFVGNITQGPPTEWVGNTTATPVGWVIKYFLEDIKARYAQLRNLGLFNPEHVAGLVKAWCDRIGEDLFEKEYEKWPESPCCRDSQINTDYWQRKTYTVAVTAWTAEASFANNALAYEGGKVWQSRKANNTGNNPSEDDGTNWLAVSYDPEKEYAKDEICYHGVSLATQYRFQCVEPCTGQPPFKGYYVNYPRELGYYDSPYRVLKWVTARVNSVDRLLGYTAPADLSRASVISPAMIEDIINQ